MSKLSFDLYLDESGNFESDPNAWATVSMVGGLLIPSHRAGDQMINSLVTERIHAKEHYEHDAYFEILRRLIREQGKFVIFNNEERISVINGDFTYLNIISEGIVQLIRNLKIAYPQDEIGLHILIAGRQAMAYKRDENIPEGERVRIQQDEYFARIEEKLIIAIGRSKIEGIQWDVRFGTGDVDKRLMLADLICFTWRFRKGREFSPEEKDEIEAMIDPSYVYSVFENAAIASLKRLLLEERYEELLYQLCNLRKLSTAQSLCQQLLSRMSMMPVKELAALLNYMSMQIGRLNDLYQFADGIALALNYKERILSSLQEAPQKYRSTVDFAFFDTDFYLLTMYDHIGNAAKCQQYLDACKRNIASVRKPTWEHMDYYFRFRIREMNVLMGRFAFEEILERSHELVVVLKEARDLFSMIKTYDGEEQTLHSELLGKIYGVRIEAMINLLHRNPQLLQEAVDTSDLALAEFSSPADISRQQQWRCLLMTEAGDADAAMICLLCALGAEDTEKPFAQSVHAMYHDAYQGRDYLLWHYTNVMLLLKKKQDVRADAMYQALNVEPLFKADLQNQQKGGHPWNLVLWNLARYVREGGDTLAFDRHYSRALSITRSNKENVTMMTFSLSMSADRLLWCQEHHAKDTLKAQNEFLDICKDMRKAGMTDEMNAVYPIAALNDPLKITSDVLVAMADAWLR